MESIENHSRGRDEMPTNKNVHWTKRPENAEKVKAMATRGWAARRRNAAAKKEALTRQKQSESMKRRWAEKRNTTTVTTAQVRETVKDLRATETQQTTF